MPGCKGFEQCGYFYYKNILQKSVYRYLCAPNPKELEK